MSAYTPGPWYWYWRQSDGETDCGVYSEKHQGHAYSVCRAPRYQTEDQWAADARLIAAAPELLNLAERVARLNRDAGRIGAGMLAHLIDEARAAIAKATQEPQT